MRLNLYRFGRFRLPSLALIVFAAFLATGTEGIVKKTTPTRAMGQIVDWSSRHVLYPQGLSLRALAMSQRDPRAYWNYLNLMRAAIQPKILQSKGPLRPPPRKHRPAPRPDWSVSLGAAGTAANMYPAKFSFDVNAAPSCASDYVVFAINTTPSATQANIAAFNNLYSGPTSSCGAITAATPLWAYIAGAQIATSPIISLDGTKVAWVDDASPAVFHLLAPGPGQGTVGAPATPIPTGPGTQILNVTLTGATTDSNSSLFMDYFNGVGYVGTDNGLLFKINNVFTGPTLAGGAWPVTVGTGVLTSPVIDFGTGNILVGSSDGKLYGFTASGTPITGSPLAVGSGGANGGIVDGPILDVVNGLVFVTTGENAAAANAVVVQTGTANFSTVNVAPLGNNNTAMLHDGAFNNAYFNAATNMTGTTNEWFFYACGVAVNPGTSPVLYRVGFNGNPRQMNTTVDATTVSLSANAGEQCSPITEFNNGVDRIFLGLMTAARVEFFDVSTTTAPVLGGTGAVAPVAEAGGTSGIIVDNTSAITQASSMYFTTQASSANCGGNFCAVKLTQGGLQ